MASALAPRLTRDEYCFCDLKMTPRVAISGGNAGRFYLSCPKRVKSDKCKFFAWLTEADGTESVRYKFGNTKTAALQARKDKREQAKAAKAAKARSDAARRSPLSLSAGPGPALGKMGPVLGMRLSSTRLLSWEDAP